MKQYQGSSSHEREREREQQGATSTQQQSPSSQKEVSNRKSEAQKKIKTTKPGEHRETR